MLKNAMFAGLLAFAVQGMLLPGVAGAADAGKGAQEILAGLKSKLNPGLVDGTQPEEVLVIAKGFGLAELEKDDEGDPMITGRMQGIKYGVNFYGCVDNKACSTIQMTAFFDGEGVSVRNVNTWNTETRFGKAYIDEDGDAAIEMNVNLGYGVSRKNLEDTFDWWMLVLKEFTEFLENPSGYSPDKPPAPAPAIL